MHSLIYCSRESSKMSEDKLMALLKKARQKNEGCNVTGMLLYRNGFFLQCLEGAYDDIKNIFSNIMMDNRHKMITILFNDKIEKRIFPQWTMDFIKEEDLNSEIIENLKKFDFSNPVNSQEESFDLIKKFMFVRSAKNQQAA